MSLTLSGSGTIGGLVAGGLPDGTVLPADLSTGSPSWDSSGNMSFNSGYGSVATAYGCRAWVNFNGTGTVAIRASGNVSSITDNGTGDYTVNFTTAMPDANYGITTSTTQAADQAAAPALGVRIATDYANGTATLLTSSQVRLINRRDASYDCKYLYVSIFR